MLFPPRVLFWLLIAAIPAYFLNRYLLKTVRPKESFGRFLLYLLICLAFAFAYTWLAVFLLFKILGLPKQ